MEEEEEGPDDVIEGTEGGMALPPPPPPLGVYSTLRGRGGWTDPTRKLIMYKRFYQSQTLGVYLYFTSDTGSTHTWP